MNRMSYSSMRRTLAETLNQVAYGGDRLVVQRRGKDVAALVPLEDLELLEAFEDRLDVEAAERALADPENQQPIPWEEARRALLETE